jgi:RNA polymerase, sigma 70 subunit, RpoD
MATQDQQSQIRELIARGKEQGYLTYAEVNDHLPDDIVEPEQIEDIIGMINDMGIPVHETAPDADTLLLSDGAVSTDEDEAEEAAAALAAVDAEFGRTTDPVRMYMREMGTVELLTREGEIELAKRIEDGLDQVLRALAGYPESSRTMVALHHGIQNSELRLGDVVAGFRDITDLVDNVPELVAVQQATAAEAAREAEEAAAAAGDEEGAAVADTGPDPERAAEIFDRIEVLHGQLLEVLDTEGSQSPQLAPIREEMTGLFLAIKFVPKVIEGLPVICVKPLSVCAPESAKSCALPPSKAACRAKTSLPAFLGMRPIPLGSTPSPSRKSPMQAKWPSTAKHCLMSRPSSRKLKSSPGYRRLKLKTSTGVCRLVRPKRGEPKRNG